MGLSKPIIISTSAVDTSNLATKSDLDTLANTVESSLANVGGAVKSIQKGFLGVNKQNYKDITISSVDTNKTTVRVTKIMDYNDGSHLRTGITTTTGYDQTDGYLVSGTKVRVLLPYGNSITDSYQVQWEVIEFY